MGARYQSGEQGRFISQDPVSQLMPDAFLFDPQQLNMYAYSRNNPLRFIDPTGLYNTETGEIEEGDTQDGIVQSINDAFGIETDWDTISQVSFYGDRFGDQSLDQLVGQNLYIGTEITPDITQQLNDLNQFRARLGEFVGAPALALFAPHMPWDIKNSSDAVLGGGADRKNLSYIYNGKLIRYDAPGNINYGYVARSMGYSPGVVQGGASLEQAVHSYLQGSGFRFSDNAGDRTYVQMGIDGAY